MKNSGTPHPHSTPMVDSATHGMFMMPRLGVTRPHTACSLKDRAESVSVARGRRNATAWGCTIVELPLLAARLLRLGAAQRSQDGCAMRQHTPRRGIIPIFKKHYSPISLRDFLCSVTIADHIRPSSKRGVTCNLWANCDWTGHRGEQKRDTCSSHPECHVGLSPR